MKNKIEIKELKNNIAVFYHKRLLCILDDNESFELGMRFIGSSNTLKKDNVKPIEKNIDFFECDFLNLLIFHGSKKFTDIATFNLNVFDLLNKSCREIYSNFIERAEKNLPYDFLSSIQNPEHLECFKEMSIKINPDCKEKYFLRTIERILDRNWMNRREEIKRKIYENKCSDGESLDLLKEFSFNLRNKPEVKIPRHE